MRQPLANQVALHCSGWSFREAVAVISAKVMECEINASFTTKLSEGVAVISAKVMECESSENSRCRVYKSGRSDFRKGHGVRAPLPSRW